MSAPIVPIPSFKSGGSIRGIPYSTIYVAIGLTTPFAFLFNVYLQGLIWVVAVAGVLFMMVKLAEILTQVIPKGYIYHLLDWLQAGAMLYATHDAKPVPLMIDPNQDYKTAERERRLRKRQQGRR